MKEIDLLKEKLKELILDYNYKEAAKLQAKINKLEKELGQ